MDKDERRHSEYILYNYDDKNILTTIDALQSMNGGVVGYVISGDSLWSFDPEHDRYSGDGAYEFSISRYGYRDMTSTALGFILTGKLSMYGTQRHRLSQGEDFPDKG